MNTIRTVLDASLLWGTLLIIAATPIWGVLVPAVFEAIVGWTGW